MWTFDEYAIPDNMSDGDALTFLRLTCKAKSLRRFIARRHGHWRGLGHELEQTKREIRDLATRYA